MKRGAYFFVLDAFIAGIIIISSLAVLFSVLSLEENPSQNYVLADDFISFLETTTVAEYGGDLVFQMRLDGDIDDSSVTLLEQIAIFYDQGRYDNITSLLSETSALAPSNSGIGFYVTDAGITKSIYNKTPTMFSYDEARIQLAARRIVLVRGQAQITPYVMEVRIWR